MGSSARMSLGFWMTARATPTNCCWPPESWLGKRSFLATILKRSRASQTRLARSFLRDIFVGERDFEVFVDGEIVDEVVGLEDEADVVFVEFVALLVVEFVNGLIEEIVFAGPGTIEHADDAEEGGLPCPGRTHEGDEFAGQDVESDATEDVEFVGTGIGRIFRCS